MTTVFIILAIIWIIVPIAMKKKQQQAKADAERQRAARAAAQQPAAQARAQQPMRTAPLTPSMRSTQTTMQPSLEGLGSQEGQSGAVLQGEQPHDVATNLKKVTSSLTEARISITHTVSASSESGHTHEETSASGVTPDCPPGQASVDQVVQAAQSGENAYLWDVTQARTGLVMAEILGPCLALRD